jgi:hypothetical protein
VYRGWNTGHLLTPYSFTNLKLQQLNTLVIGIKILFFARPKEGSRIVILRRPITLPKRVILDSMYRFFSFSCLFILLTIVIPVFARPMQALESKRLVTLEIKDQNFSRTIEAIAGQLKIEILYHGPEPAAKRDISLANVPLDQAVSRIMRTYGIENHVTVYNTDKNILVQVEVHGFSGAGVVLPLQNQKRPGMGADRGPLTLDQTDRLIAQSALIDAEMDENSRRLTPEQVEQLKSHTEEIEAEKAKSMKPLTPQQLDQLKTRSQKIELEQQHDQPLTPEQLQKLRRNSDRIEAELEGKSQPLTNEKQILLLKEPVQD